MLLKIVSSSRLYLGTVAITLSVPSLSPFSAVTLLVDAGVGDDFLKGLKEEIKWLITNWNISEKNSRNEDTSLIRTPHTNQESSLIRSPHLSGHFPIPTL